MENGRATYCLLCAELKPLAEVIDVDNQIEEIIIKLTRINATAALHSVNLPKFVCLKCISLLNEAYQFVLVVERAQNALLNLNRNIKQEICDNFETTQIVIEIKAEKVENDVENSLKNEDEEVPPASSIEAPVETSITNATVKKEKETAKLNTKPKRKKKKCETPATNPPSTWEDYIWKCGFCDTEFPTHEELKTHAMKFHKRCNAQKCYDCNIRVGNLDQFNKHVRRHRKHLSYSCYTCFKTFPTPCKAGIHRHTHRPLPHYCKGCNTSFATEIQLKDHTSTYYKLFCERTALKTDDVICKECDKTFDNPKALKKHMILHTNRKRDYTCETCGKCFLIKQTLSAHMTAHTDERPFPCTICTQRFKQQVHLYKHLQTHNAENLYTCDVCNRSFKFKKYLDNHKIVHTDLLPHVCSYCNKGFRYKTILNLHLRQHTGDKPYICSVCQRQFTNWSNWNKHMKRRHNMNMSKRQPVHTSEETSESMKEYVETVSNEEVPLKGGVDQGPSENLEHS